MLGSTVPVNKKIYDRLGKYMNWLYVRSMLLLQDKEPTSVSLIIAGEHLGRIMDTLSDAYDQFFRLYQLYTNDLGLEQ